MSDIPTDETLPATQAPTPPPDAPAVFPDIPAPQIVTPAPEPRVRVGPGWQQAAAEFMFQLAQTQAAIDVAAGNFDTPATRLLALRLP